MQKHFVKHEKIAKGNYSKTNTKTILRKKHLKNTTKHDKKEKLCVKVRKNYEKQTISDKKNNKTAVKTCLLTK